MRVHVIDNTCETYVLEVFPILNNSAVFPSGLVTKLLLTPGFSGHSQFDTKGVILDSTPNSLGERNCFHMHLEGELTSISSADVESLSVAYQQNSLSPQVTVPGVKFYTPRGWSTIRSADLHFNSVSSSLKQYPDFEASKVRYKDIYCAIWSPESDLWMREVSWYFSVSPYTSWSNVTFRSGYQIDRVLRRSRRTTDKEGTNWTSYYSWSLDKLTRKDAGAPQPTLNSFPRTWKDYFRLSSSLGKHFDYPIESDVYGDLVRRCANDARVIQTNGIELAAELVEIRGSVMKALALAGKEVSPAAVGAAYLSYKYGLRLTGIGVKSVFDDVANELSRRFSSSNIARSRATEVIRLPSHSASNPMDCLVQYHYKMFHSIRSNDWRDSLRVWLDSGLFPSLTNVWDLIPLSFVFDWFVKMEGYLNAIDANTYWSLYDILGITYSQKRTYSGISYHYSKVGYTLFGDASFIDYDRRTRRDAHKPLFFESSPRIFKNYAELTALLVANSH